MYELTSDLGTLHSLENVRLFFGEDTLGLSLSMQIRIYLFDHEDNEVLVLRKAFNKCVSSSDKNAKFSVIFISEALKF